MKAFKADKCGSISTLAKPVVHTGKFAFPVPAIAIFLTLDPMAGLVPKIGDWRVDVKFREKGNLLATASGVLLVPPEDALALVTDAGEHIC